MHRRALLVTLSLLIGVTAVVSSLGAPLIPTIARHFDVPLTIAQWGLTATLLAGAVATPIVGRLGDGALRRPTILVTLAIVITGTVLAAFPLGFEAFVAGRALQGVGMGLVPLAIGVARDVLAADDVPSAVALLSVAAVAGAGLGYPLTALVAEHGGMRAAFWMGAALTTTTFLVSLTFLPPGPRVDLPPVDWLGALGLSAGMASLLMAVTQGDQWGWWSARTAGLGAVGVLLLGVWVRWTLTRRHPLVDLRLAMKPGVVGPNLIVVAAGVGMYTLLTLVIVLVQADEPGFGLDRSVIVASLVLVPYSVMSVAGSRLALFLLRRTGPYVLLPVGCLVFMLAGLGLAFLHGNLVLALVWMAVGGLGSGLTFSSLPVLIVPNVPRHETSSALAFNQVLRYLGFSVGSSLSVTLMALFGGGSDGFRAALVAVSLVWILAILGLWWLRESRKGRRPSDRLETPRGRSRRSSS